MKYKEILETHDPEAEVELLIIIDRKHQKLLIKLFLMAILIVFSFFMSIRSFICFYNTYF